MPAVGPSRRLRALVAMPWRTEGAPSMDPRNAVERARSDGPDEDQPDAVDFVRFCYRRRRVGWPELYDEMCAVAGRGLYRGLGSDDLSRLGIGFSLFEMQALAALVQQVVAEDQTRRRLTAEAARPIAHHEPVDAAVAASPRPIAVQPEPEPERLPTLVAVAAGA